MTSEQTTQGVARRVFTRSLLSVLALQLAFVPLTIAADGDDALVAEPTKIIDEAAQKIVAVLARTEESAEVRIGEIEEIAYEIFDFTTMSKLVLARNWRKLDKEKRAEFVREFRTHLSRTYGTRLDNFSDIGVDVYGAQVEVRNDVTVKSRVVGGQFDGSELAYRMRNRKEGWKIIDVVIEGVSLVSNYRSQFATVLNGGTIDDLITKLKDKNFVVESGEADAG
ncbi:MAG: MlaC/ttg2D family ABC transporter substrate-binding protein [Myxococcota bacterium]